VLHQSLNLQGKGPKGEQHPQLSPTDPHDALLITPIMLYGMCKMEMISMINWWQYQLNYWLTTLVMVTVP